MIWAKYCCLILFRQLIFLPEYFARAMAGNNMEARMAIIAITTKSSIKVKPEHLEGLGAIKKPIRRTVCKFENVNFMRSLLGIFRTWTALWGKSIVLWREIIVALNLSSVSTISSSLNPSLCFGLRCFTLGHHHHDHHCQSNWVCSDHLDVLDTSRWDVGC